MKKKIIITLLVSMVALTGCTTEDNLYQTLGNPLVSPAPYESVPDDGFYADAGNIEYFENISEEMDAYLSGKTLTDEEEIETLVIDAEDTEVEVDAEEIVEETTANNSEEIQDAESNESLVTDNSELVETEDIASEIVENTEEKDLSHIQIFAQGYVDQNLIQHAVDKIYALPANVINAINVPITFYEEDLAVVLGDGDEYDTILGVTNYVNYEATEIWLDTNPQMIDNGVLHEIGHSLDSYRQSSTDEFIDIYYSEVDNSGFIDHCKSNNQEYFAEAFQQYFANGNNLYERCPRTYMFIDAFVNSL